MRAAGKKMCVSKICAQLLFQCYMRACVHVCVCETTRGTAPKSRSAPDAGDDAAQSPGGRGGWACTRCQCSILYKV